MPEIAITGADSELRGVGRLSDGRAVFVTGALPGEVIDARVIREAARFCEAELLRVIMPSARRVSPDCEWYARCGGCCARHCDYEYTLEMKRARVTDALERISGLRAPNVEYPIGCDKRRSMRNKAEYAISGGEIGMRARRGREILPVRNCLLQTEGSLNCLRYVAARITRAHEGYLVTRENRRGEIMVILSLASGAPAWLGDMVELPGVVSAWHCALKPRPANALDGVCRHIAGDETLSEQICGLNFDISPQTFMQVNTEQAEKLYDIAIGAMGECKNALDAYCGAGAMSRRIPLKHPCNKILDAYCGAGAMTMMAARVCNMATGVEIVAPAVADARKNAARNALTDKTHFILGDVSIELPKLVARGERFDCAILDPPRKGVDARALAALDKIGRLIYVSCDPATLARDIKQLAARGFSLEWARPVDMFPWTAHVETVALLTRASE